MSAAVYGTLPRLDVGKIARRVVRAQAAAASLD
jgi:hypothetical protein